MAADASASMSPDENPARADALGAALAQHVAARAGDEQVVLIVDDAHALGTGGLAARAARCPRSPCPRAAAHRAGFAGTLPIPIGRLLIDGQATELTGTNCRSLPRRPPSCSATKNRQSRRRRSRSCSIAPVVGPWRSPLPLAPPASRMRRDGRQRIAPNGSCSPTSPRRCSPPNPATRAALRVAAALPWLTPNLATHLGLGEEGAQLAEPERTSIMMTPVADLPGAVAVTPLVRQLLGVDQTTTLDVAVGEAAASWYEDHGAHAAALACVVRLGSSERLAAFLRRHGHRLLATGHGADVLDALESVGSGSDDIGIELGHPVGGVVAGRRAGRRGGRPVRRHRSAPWADPNRRGVASRLVELPTRRYRWGERRTRTRAARRWQSG